MSLRRTQPVALRPRGLSDALDSSTAFSGAMQSLQDLIPDPSTKNLWQCRPASLPIVLNLAIAPGGPFSSGFNTGFSFVSSGIPAPVGLISCMKVIGTRVYGLVNAGGVSRDYPFGYDLLTNTFVTIGGAGVAANQPASPATTGEWVPPKMALVGTNLLVTHPGYTGAAGVFFGWFDIGDPGAVTWNGGNLTGAITFSTPPTSVENFNGRAYWAVNPPTGQPSLIFSDVLLPRNVTNANQALTFDDNVKITALAGLPLNTMLTGGILQALIVFKGVTALYQVTGDAALSNLAKNALNVATGTLAPNSIRATAKGLAFVAPDGVRLIDFTANVSDPIGLDGMGKALPFLYSVVPSRMTAASNGTIYRVTVQDGSLLGSPWVEYWFDIARGIFHGPHTFPASCIEPYANTFVVAPRNVPGSLFQSDYLQSATSSFTENFVPMQFLWSSCMLPDTDQMAENAMIETTIHMSLGPGQNYFVSALDQNGAVLNVVNLINPNAASIWGTFVWGTSQWGGQQSALFPRAVAWSKPIVFRRMRVAVSGPSSGALRIGALHMRYEQLGYLQQGQAA